MISEDAETYISMTLRDSENGGPISMRKVFLGSSPMIFIEPFSESDGSFTFEIDATDLDQEGLAEVLIMLGEMVRDGK